MHSAPVPIAIVGLGYGRWILEALGKPELSKLFRIVAVCDLNSGLATHFSSELGVPTATLNELLADPDLHAIGLFTGPAGRADLVRKIVHAGKHVMTTKPFELHADAAHEVLELARSLGKVVYLNSPSPVLSADLQQIADWRAGHNLGRPVAAHASTWVRYNETADGSWQDDPDQCPAAPVFRIGIYLINDLIEIFGEAEEVQVLSSRFFTKRPTADHAQLGIKFCNGGLASILASFCIEDGDNYRNRLILNFEYGTVFRNIGLKDSRTACELSLVMQVDGSAREVERVTLPSTSGTYPWHAFHDAITSSEAPVFADSKKVSAGLNVIAAMRRAETEGTSKVLPTQ